MPDTGEAKISVGRVLEVLGDLCCCGPQHRLGREAIPSIHQGLGTVMELNQ